MNAVTILEAQLMEFLATPMPVAKPDELVVKVRVAGITASDRRAYYGAPPGKIFPFVPGKNFAGEVASVGLRVEGFQPGDPVAVDPILSCGACRYCLEKRFNLCPSLSVMGIHRPGGMAEYVAVPASNVHVVPGDWLWEQVVMVEPFSTAAHILEKGALKRGDKILVVGAGTPGLMLLLIARFLGVSVAVAGALASRLQAASTMGADLTLNVNDGNFEEILKGWTDGMGVDAVFDTVSLEGFFPKLLNVAAPGARIVSNSFSDLPLTVLPSSLAKKELVILGARLHSGQFPQVIRWFALGDIQPERLVSHSFNAADAADAFRMMEESPADARRVLLTFNDAG